MTMAPGPLDGIRVVDFSLYLPGPYCTRLLADLGADVIKVEPMRGDLIQSFMPGAYDFLNRGKRVVQLDLRDPGGLQFALALVRTADVVLEGFRPGVAERLGIGYAALASSRPGLVYASISGYGQDGPYRMRPGHDIGYEASGGVYAASVAAGEDLVAPYVPIGDVGSASLTATTICAYLASPREDAVYLDVSMQESVTHLSIARWAAALRDGTDVDPEALASFAPGNGLYETADGRWVAIAAVEQHFWAGLSRALDAPELNAPPYDTHPPRMRDRGALRARIAERIAALPLEELTQRMHEHDVPLDLVQTAPEVACDPHLNARGAFLRVADGIHPDFPIRHGGGRSRARLDQPDPARDEAELRTALGLARAEA
jgi:crotonobetainyl-CoA:carnitine CoA-transferase CaiB-like acyl-CoA transferase